MRQPPTISRAWIAGGRGFIVVGAVFAATAGCTSGLGADGGCLLRTETQADGTVAFIDIPSGVVVATCDSQITSCTEPNGNPADAALMRACLDAGPSTP